MEIRFKYHGKVISEEQSVGLGNYDKEFIENGSLKKNYFYHNSVLHSIDWYLSEEENEMNVVESLTPLAKSYVDILSPKQPLSDFYVQDSRHYQDGKLFRKFKSLYDSYDNLICVQKIDINSNEPIFKETTKYYYGTAPVINDEEVFEAEYNSDGSLSLITFFQLEDDWNPHKYYRLSNFPELQERFTKDISYYLNATLEP